MRAPLVEKAPYLVNRFVDSATFADKCGGALLVVAADGQPRFSRSLERSHFVYQGVRGIAIPVEAWPSLNSDMFVAMIRDRPLGEAVFSREP